jgi:hypothetical protein
MPVGDVTFSGGAIGIITLLLTALTGAVVALYRAGNVAQADRYTSVIAAKDAAFLAVIAAKDQAMQDMISQRNSYQKMATQSITGLELAANRLRQSRGEGPIEFVKPVVPEHNSPTTQAQIDTAELQTLRARAVAAALVLDVPLVDPDQPNTVTLHPGESLNVVAEPPTEPEVP